MKTPLKRARKTAQKAAVKSAATEKNATQKTTPKSPAKPAAKPAIAAEGSTPSARETPKLSAKKTTAAKAAVRAIVPTTLFEMAPEQPKTKSAAKAPALHATKKRAPKDLANQYGEVVKVARTAVAETAPRKRRNAASRAKLQAAITPDDGLLLRLARAGAISSSHAGENGNGDDEKPFRVTAKRRSRKWETRCGKCGVNAQYSSSAALCVKCGAILVRD